MADKKSSEVLDLPVVDLSNGASVGKVVSLVVDAAKKQIIGMEVTSKSLLKSKTCFIPINKLKHIGSDAVTVNDTGSLLEEGTTSELKKPEQPNLLRKKVISEKGVLAGSVEDFSFDENGNLKDLYLSGKRKADFLKGNILLSASAILNIGQDYVIVTGDYATQLEKKDPAALKQLKNNWHKIKSKTTTESSEESESLPGDTAEITSIEKEIREFFVQLQDLGKLTLEKVGEVSTDKMRQFLLDKKVPETIQIQEKNLLLEKDQIIDSDTLQKIEEAGLLLKLFTNVMRGEVQSQLKHGKNFLEETFEKKDKS